VPGVIGRSGGARIGAGRPRKSDSARWLGGNAGKRGTKAYRSAEPVQPLPPVEMPLGLTTDEVAIWKALSPLALAARTLTVGTSGDFAVLCALEVELASVLKERRNEGWTTRGMFLAKEFRGLVARVEAKRRAFRLAPMGKEMVVTEAQKDEWAEFDQAETVQ
jgi:hypothetical protein